VPDMWWYEKRKCWCADIPDPKGRTKRRRLYLGTDKRKAKHKLFEALARCYADEPTEQPASQGNPSLAKVMARFCEWAETNLAKSTLERYIYALRPFVEEHGHRAAAEINPLMAETQKAKLKREEASPRTINYFVQALKRVLNWAVDYSLVKENPVARLKRVPKAALKDKSLDDETICEFLCYAHTREPLGDVCEVLLNTGMRVGELIKLRWSDVNLENRVARLFEHKTAQRGNQKPRTIPLNDRVMEILEAQSHHRDFVFTGESGQPLTYAALMCRKQKLDKKHRDMPRITFHQFRHTFATRCARAGVPERVAQEILGHASTMMTRYYTNTPVAEMLDAVKKASSLAADDSSMSAGSQQDGPSKSRK